MAKQRKNSKSTQKVEIRLSRRAFLYFFTYHWWAIFKKLALWMLIATVAATAISLTRSVQIFGMADQDIARAFIAPLPRTALIFLVAISLYAILRAIIANFSTKYAFTPKGVVIQSGWPTRHTTIVDYGHIQKMTIVSNPLDRLLKASYIQLDLIGGAPGILLEAVDAQTVLDIQEKLSTPNSQLITATASALSGIQKKPKPSAEKLPQSAALKQKKTSAPKRSKSPHHPKKSRRKTPKK